MSVETLPDPPALARRVADWLFDLARAKEGTFALCLSGGATPRRLYELLGEPPFRASFPWARTHLFWGDERFVAPDDPRSNLRMVREALLSRIDIPPANIRPIPTVGLTPADAADRYERILRGFHRADPDSPLFDATLLGLGPDGHTASLFPGTAVLEERERWVAPVEGAETRVTLTYPALENSRHIAFLVDGAAKRDILARALGGDTALPAARLKPRGELRWFVDRAANP
ncbi:MAG: 6-phosphogluconolactonase [Rhizomicrobium sp.]